MQEFWIDNAARRRIAAHARGGDERVISSHADHRQALKFFTESGAGAPQTEFFLIESPPVMAERFLTGDTVPATGLYLVHHSAHRLPHEALLLRDEKFPRCAKCADRVEFELLKAVPGFDRHRDRIARLYELPAVDDNGADMAS